MAYIEMKNSYKRYHVGDTEIIANNDVNFEIEKGELVIILGASGAGKSTVLNILGGMDTNDEGQVLIDGVDITDPSVDLNQIRRKVGMVFQSFNLFENMSVIENIKLAPKKLLHISDAAAEKEARQLLKRVGLLDKADMMPKYLSGGQKQRIAIARALAMHPEAVLFDEPTSALDPEMIGEVLDVIRDLAKDGLTMVIVTHEMSFAREVGTRMIFLDRGKIIEDGTPKQVMDHPKTERVKRFFEKH